MAHDDPTQRFYKLIWPHRAAVLRLAQFLMSNQAEGEDLAQETLLKAFKAMDTLHNTQGVRAWLMTILRRTRIDRARLASSAEVSFEQLDMDLAGPEISAGEPLDAAAVAADPDAVLNAFSDAAVIKALRTLPQEIRWTLLLVDVEGLDQNEAATILDVPTGTIKSRLHRGRNMLRAVLQPP